MKTKFEPDYRNITDAARNRESARLPLYEHIISFRVVESILGRKFADLLNGDYEDQKEFFRTYCGFLTDHGYDVVPFECGLDAICPGGGALGCHKPGCIKTMQDLIRYPWEEIPELYIRAYQSKFDALAEVIPDGMKAVGGVGNGVFEGVQDLTGYINLCFIREDDPELYEALFSKVGGIRRKVWDWFLKRYSDLFCVMRFGDDLGFATSTLLTPEDIRRLVIPEYRTVIGQVHAAGRPFLLHSCGNIFGVMEELIDAGIDAKHSNEDKIAPFPVWVEKYGDRIGNFGGIDMDCLCRLDEAQMREYITDVLRKCEHHGGFAFGTGNSIADYVPPEGYLNMIRIVRQWRGDY